MVEGLPPRVYLWYTGRRRLTSGRTVLSATDIRKRHQKHIVKGWDVKRGYIKPAFAGRTQETTTRVVWRCASLHVVELPLCALQWGRKRAAAVYLKYMAVSRTAARAGRGRVSSLKVQQLPPSLFNIKYSLGSQFCVVLSVVKVCRCLNSAQVRPHH